MTDILNKLITPGGSQMRSFVFTLLLTITLLSGCSLLPVKKPDNPDYVTPGAEVNLNALSLRNALTKTSSNAGGFFEISLTPLSEPYIRARREELVLLRGLNKTQVHQLEEQDVKSYLKGKTCFEVEAEITRHEKAKDLAQWGAVAYDDEKKQYDLDWVEMGTLIETKFQSSHGKIRQWVSSGLLCSQDEIDLVNGFEVVLSPDFVPWPFPKDMIFAWIFQGTEEEKKKQKRSYKRYRGY